MSKFSGELDSKFLEKALRLKDKLSDNGYDGHSLEIGVSTDKIFEKGFSIAEVAHNEFS